MRRFLLLTPFIVSIAGAQTMTEMSGAVAGGALGSAAGRKVSEGITAIFGKVDAKANKAAKPEEPAKKEPLIDVGEATPKPQVSSDSVPPPPPAAGARRAPKPAPEPAMPEILPPPPPPPPPPPQVTREELKSVASGMKRDELLKLGAPASRITMDDDGHLMETYTYYVKDTAIGRVKLTDGNVTSVEVW